MTTPAAALTVIDPVTVLADYIAAQPPFDSTRHNAVTLAAWLLDQTPDTVFEHVFVPRRFLSPMFMHWGAVEYARMLSEDLSLGGCVDTCPSHADAREVFSIIREHLALRAEQPLTRLVAGLDSYLLMAVLTEAMAPEDRDLRQAAYALLADGMTVRQAYATLAGVTVDSE